MSVRPRRRYRLLCRSHIDVNLVAGHHMVPLPRGVLGAGAEPCEWCLDGDVRGDGLAVALVDLRILPPGSS